MLAYTLLATTLLTGVLATPDPMITPPASLKNRRDFGDIGDSIDNAIGDAKSLASNVASGVSQGVDCIDKLEDISDLDNDMPTPDDDNLRSAIASHLAASGDNCIATSELQPTLTSAWASYESVWASWYKSASPVIQSAADACPTLPTELAKALEPCPTALEAAGVTAVVFDGTSNGGSGGNSTNNDNGASTRGVVAGGAALIAFGAAAFLL